MTTSQNRIGMVLDGMYRLDRLLGEGGVGAVYAAWHLNLTRQVAVKLLHPQFAGHGESLERFKLEAKILSDLKHPAFVEVYDFGHAEDGTAYMVMEMIDGEPLRSRLQKGKVLSVPEALELFRPLCEAMEKAHQRKILHRDLKPDNLMLVKGGGVKILDFGMAKLLSEAAHLTSAQVVMGTPNYLAPERARGRRDADARSDIFALGAILYEALTGRFAFYGVNAMDTMRRVVSAPIEKLSLPDAELAKRLDEVIATACAKDSRDRYGSAMEMWKDLEDIEASTPIREPDADGPVSKTKVKAGIIHAIVGFVRSTYGEAGYFALCQKLGVERIRRLELSLANSWLDIKDQRDLTDAIVSVFDDGSLNSMRALGRFFATISLGTVYKAFLRPGRPEIFVKRAQTMLKTMVSEGETMVVLNGDNQWLIQVRNLPVLDDALLAAMSGWLACYFEMAKATNVKVSENLELEGANRVGNLTFSFSVPREEVTVPT